MDARRLQELAAVFVREVDEHRIAKALQQLESAFVNSVQSPSKETADALEQATKNLYEHAAAMRPLSPPRLSMLEELFAADLYGQGLIDRVRSTLSAGISPATIVSGLTDLRQRLATTRGNLETVRNGLESVNLVGRPDPAPAEVEILLPGSLYGGDLDGLSHETRRLNTALMLLVEAATGSRPPLKVQSVSTGSLQLVLTIDPPTGLMILQITTYILGAIASLVTIRKAMMEMERLKAPAQSQEINRDWYRTMIDEKLATVTTTILQGIREESRRNELEGQTRRCVEYLAQRMDEGMRVNVDTPAPGAEPSQENQQRQEIAELQRKVIELSAEIKALAPGAPVLALLESKDVASV